MDVWPIFNCVVFSPLNFKFFVHSGYKPFTRYVLRKHALPVRGLSSHSRNSTFPRATVCGFGEVQPVNFLSQTVLLTLCLESRPSSSPARPAPAPFQGLYRSELVFAESAMHAPTHSVCLLRTWVPSCSGAVCAGDHLCPDVLSWLFCLRSADYVHGGCFWTHFSTDICLFFHNMALSRLLYLYK